MKIFVFYLGAVWETMKIIENSTSISSKFQCPMCSYGTSNKFDMKKHFLIHTGERPFQCNICGKKFSRNDHLKRHIKGTHFKC